MKKGETPRPPKPRAGQGTRRSEYHKSDSGRGDHRRPRYSDQNRPRNNRYDNNRSAGQAEAGNTTATATVTEAKESVTTMTTGVLEHASPTHWTTTRGHALGSVLRDAHAHDQPRTTDAAVAPAHLHTLVPSLGARDLGAHQLFPKGRVAKHMVLTITSMLRVTLWTMQEHLKHLRVKTTSRVHVA